MTLTLLGAGVRLHGLGETSLWGDEIFTIRATESVFAGFGKKTFGYVPTALTLSFLGIDRAELTLDNNAKWRSLGVTETRARLASCLIGILTVPLLGLASRRLIGERAALILTLLLALAPWHIQWSQSARFYSQQFLFYNLSFIWYFVGTTLRSRPYLAAAAASAVLAFLTQPPALMIAGIFAADWLISRMRKEPVHLGRFGCAALAIGLSICLFMILFDQFRYPADYSYFVERARNPLKILAKTLVRVDMTVVVFALFCGRWLVSIRPRLGLYLLLGAVLPVLIISALTFRVWTSGRYSFVCLYAWLALSAIGVENLYAALRPQFGRILACAPLGLLITAMVGMNYIGRMSALGFSPRWREAFAYVASHRGPHEAVFTSSDLMGRYYLEDPEVKVLSKSLENLWASDRPAWVVINAMDPRRGRFSRVSQAAELKAVFPMHAARTRHSLFVYRYRPDGG